MRISWLSDIHLNFVTEPTIEALGKECARVSESILITGDISESHTVEPDLIKLKGYSGLPLSFVLGNHDFYGSGLCKVETSLITHLTEEDGFNYLTYSDTIELTPETCLIGDDGWYDGRNGALNGPQTMELWDFQLIEDIAKTYNPIGRLGLGPKLAELGDRAVKRVRPKLEDAVTRYKRILFATHIPPFVQASWYKGKIGESYAQPFFTSQCMGDMLDEMAAENPDVQFTVLCGHTHCYRLYKHSSNLTCITASAEYRSPTIMHVLEIEGSELTIHKYQ